MSRRVPRPSGLLFLAASMVACAWVIVCPVAASAAENTDGAAAGQKQASPSAMVRLIQKLAERGSLTQQDAQDLIAQAEADEADSRVQAAEAILASAKAEAAAARARAEVAKATAALARAQASAAQLAANQAAAVRLLLGQPAGPAGTQAPAPAAAEAAAVPEAAPAQVAATDEAPPAEPAAAPPPQEVAEAPAPTPEPLDTPEPEAKPARVPAGGVERTADGAAIVPDDGDMAGDAAPAEVKRAPNDDIDDAALAAEAAGAVAAAKDGADANASAQEAAPEKSEDAGDSEARPPAKSRLAPNDSADDDVDDAALAAEASRAVAAAHGPAAGKNDGDAIAAAQDSGSANDDVAAAGAAGAGHSLANVVPAAGVSVEAEAAALENSDSGADPAPVSTVIAKDPAPPAGNDGAAVVPEGAPEPAAEAPAATVPDDQETSSPAAAPAEQPAAPAEPLASTAQAAAPDGVVHVAYVPDVVREQIAEEVKNEVLAEARKDHWGSPSSGPEWVSRFTLYGDIRIRAEEVINHSGNNNTGAFPNFNAINTGSPFDTSTISNPNFSPQLDVDQNRNRERLRARIGATVDLQGGWTVGMRAATGNDDNPVTENQTFGAAGNGQGGDFSKYAIWLDRAYIKYQTGGNPDNAVSVTFGRFDNPFFSTSLIWANEIGMDGAALRLPAKLTFDSDVLKEFTPFLVVGAFPVFNTDLNFGTDDPAKYASYDKWLGAGQIGFDAKFGGSVNLKLAAALYAYKNIQGQLSTPFTPVSSSDSGDTDESRPAFAQNGNTYMEIRDILPGPLNDNGTIDQWQYYGLATPFKEFAITEGLYWNQFEPFQISLVSEWVKNLDYDRQAIQAIAVNNLSGTAYVGGNTGWMTTLKFGDVVLDHLGAWNASLGYRYLQSDAVVDGFDDADFGGVLTGTNLKGPTVAASLGLHPGIWFEARWMSATAIAGPVYRNDLLQFDLNAKF